MGRNQRKKYVIKDISQQGITLIALVITIIVLLILAGVSIALVAGNNGILGRATEAVNTHQKVQVLEEAEMVLSGWQTDYIVEKTPYEGRTETTQSGAIVSCTGGKITVTDNKTGTVYEASFTEITGLGEWKEAGKGEETPDVPTEVKVAGVTLNETSITLDVSGTQQLTATVSPDNATNKIVTWSSDNDEVATVSESGLVTAISGGTATITVTTEVGNKTASCTVTVLDISRIGYYADIDNNGTVDGIIYADLMYPMSGSWNAGLYASFSYSAISDAKTYNVSSSKYSGPFGENYIITPQSTTGSDRFYVMALSDVDSELHYFYDYASGNSEFAKLAVEYSENNFGEGRKETRYLIVAWNYKSYGPHATANHTDMWEVSTVQECSSSKWFVPSRAEWSAFGYNLGITKENYKDYGLGDYYWSSSVRSSKRAYSSNFAQGGMGDGDIKGADYVRLSATF